MEHFTIIFHSGMGYGRDISCFLTKKEARALHAIGNLFITKAIKQTSFPKHRHLCESPFGGIAWRNEE